MKATLLEQSPIELSTRRRTGNAVWYAVMLVLVLGVYCYPALRTRALVHSDQLPVFTAPDLPLYLSLSSLQTPKPGFVRNPSYHVDVPDNSAGFLKFRLGPVLFGYLTRALSGHLWWSLFLWNLVWWALASLTAAWLFDRFLPNTDTLLVLAGVAMLMFFNFGMEKEEITGWLHFPAVANFGWIELPYIRSFSPQVVMPVLFLYLGLQMLALRKRTWWPWPIMVMLQWFAFATFPYATPLMAAVTAIAVAGLFAVDKRELDWRPILLYGMACAVADFVFLFHGAPVFSTHASTVSLFHFEWSVLRQQLGRLWLFMGLLTALVILSRTLAPEVRWTLGALGIANMAMLLGDGFIPGPPFFITGHASYFEHATLVLLLTFLVAVAIEKFQFRPRWLQALLGAAIGFFVINGLWLAENGFRRMTPFNREQADMVNWFAQGKTGPGDLVIAQCDACGWVPFLSEAQVLFCRNAQTMLTSDQNRELYRSREAWYLYFIGKGSTWVDRVSRDPGEVHRLEAYGLYGEITSYVGTELAKQVASTRADLLPRLERIERHDPEASTFLRQFKQIWIIDNQSAPIFQRAVLDHYLDIQSQAAEGDRVIFAATPK